MRIWSRTTHVCKTAARGSLWISPLVPATALSLVVWNVSAGQVDNINKASMATVKFACVVLWDAVSHHLLKMPEDVPAEEKPAHQQPVEKTPVEVKPAPPGVTIVPQTTPPFSSEVEKKPKKAKHSNSKTCTCRSKRKAETFDEDRFYQSDEPPYPYDAYPGDQE